MIASDTIATRADEIASLIETRLGVRGRGLDKKLKRAGRLMPRWVRREAAQLVQAQRLTGYPKLMMQTDPATLDSAYRKCETWLKSVDPGKRRKDRILSFLGTNAANFLMISGAFVAYLVWAGHL